MTRHSLCCLGDCKASKSNKQVEEGEKNALVLGKCETRLCSNYTGSQDAGGGGSDCER